jgi:hypothetical protein
MDGQDHRRLPGLPEDLPELPEIKIEGDTDERG